MQQTLVETKPIEQFQDQIWELAEFERYLGIESKEEVLTNPHTTALLQVMEDEVYDQPEITQFYADAYNNYREGDPDSVKTQLDVIRGRIEHMHSDEHFTTEERADLQKKIESGAIAFEEAQLFFKMFRHVIPANKVPNMHRARGSERPVAPSLVPTQRFHDAAGRMESRRATRQRTRKEHAHSAVIDLTSVDPGSERAVPESTVEFSAEMVAQAHQVLLTILGEKGAVKRNDAAAMLNAKFDLDDPNLARKLVTAAYNYERGGENPAFTQIRDNGAKVFTRHMATATTK